MEEAIASAFLVPSRDRPWEPASPTAGPQQGASERCEEVEPNIVRGNGCYSIGTVIGAIAIKALRFGSAKREPKTLA